MEKKYVFLFLAVAFFNTTRAQTLDKVVLSSDGSNFISGALQLSYTLGEMVAEYYSEPSFQISLGFHDQYNVVSVSLIEMEENTSINIFPNPTSEAFIIENDNGVELKFYITNTSGQLMYQDSCNTNMRIDLSKFCSGTYYINLILKDKTITKKIIKL